jgi:threonine/homoserine/homoserine lactone efflux protein
VLSEAIGDLLPTAVAVALSPIPIVAVVLVLGSSHARRSGPAFAFGWVAGLLSVSTAVVLLLADGADADYDDPGLNWFKIVVGCLFLVMAGKQWQKRANTKQPAWMATIDTATPSKALVLGLALSAANPKNLALSLAASASIAEAALPGVDSAIAVAVFVAIGSVTVVGAVLAYMVNADRVARPLESIRVFMSANNAVIMMVVLLLLGAKMLGDGLAYL